MSLKLICSAMAATAILATASYAKGSEPAPLIPVSAFDPALLLAPPPTPQSDAGAWELGTLHAIEATRSPAAFARAKHDDETKDATIFNQALGAGIDIRAMPDTWALMDLVRAEEKAVANEAKDHFRRTRPWIIDPSLHVCATDDGPQTSYPSGHTTMGYAMGEILARLAPGKAPAILARSAGYAQNRLVCGMHFSSDIAAGQVLATVIVERLMQNPAFLKAFGRAKTEMEKNGLK